MYGTALALNIEKEKQTEKEGGKERMGITVFCYY